jgi:hypothetical protein
MKTSLGLSLAAALLALGGGSATANAPPTVHGGDAPERRAEGLIYCGLGTGKQAYLPSFYVDPSLYGVGMGPPGPTNISLCATYGATAKIVLLAPRGVTIRLDTPVGARIGTLYAKVHIGKRTVNLTRPLASIVTAAPSRYLHNACAPGRHDAVWLLRATDGKVHVALPVYVDATAGDSAYRLQFCFGSPNGKRPIAGWPAGATFRLLNLTFDRSVLDESPTEPAAYVWHGFFTPFRTTGWPNPAATVEGRATQVLPIVWTLNGTYNAPAGAARLTGSLTQGGRPVAGLKFVLWHGTALGGGGFPGILGPTMDYATTDAAGQFSAAFPIAATTYFRASGGTVLRYSRCEGPSSAPKGCVSASTSGFAGASAIVAVPVP